MGRKAADLSGAKATDPWCGRQPGCLGKGGPAIFLAPHWNSKMSHADRLRVASIPRGSHPVADLVSLRFLYIDVDT